jgi:hypothetical protein
MAPSQRILLIKTTLSFSLRASARLSAVLAISRLEVLEIPCTSIEPYSALVQNLETDVNITHTKMTSVEVPKKHKALVYDKPGSISTKIEEIDTPEPGVGEVLVNL